MDITKMSLRQKEKESINPNKKKKILKRIYSNGIWSGVVFRPTSNFTNDRSLKLSH